MHFSWITQEAVPGSVASNTLDSLRIEVGGSPVHTFLTPFGTEEDFEADVGAVLSASISDYDSGYRVARTVSYTITGSEQSIHVHPYDGGQGYFDVAASSPVPDPEPADPVDPDPESGADTGDPVVPEPAQDPDLQDPDPVSQEPEQEQPPAVTPVSDPPTISPSLAVLFIAAGAALVAVALRH